MTVLLLALLLQTSPQSAAPPPPTGSIRGRVVRADGFPVRRARVRLTSIGEALYHPGVPTDEDGRYEFPEVKPGSYVISVSKLGYATAAFGQRRPTDRGDPVTVTAGATVEHVDITLPRAAVVTGVISDENGEPIENSSVSVWQIRFSAGRRRLVSVPGVPSRRTNDLGRYRLFGLRPGRYLVSAVVGQLIPGEPTLDVPGYVRTYFPGTPIPTEAQAVDVRVGVDALNVNFSLARGRTARISGAAFSSTGEPVQNLTLMPSYRSSAIATDSVGARTHIDGSFEFANVSPGEYVVQAARPRANQSTEGEFGAQFVTVNGVDVDDVVIHMSAGSSISGRVIFEDGEPPKAQDFEISPTPVDLDLTPLVGNPTASANAYEDWTFAMRGINGPRRLRVTRAPSGWMLKSILHAGMDITDLPLTFGTSEQSLADVEVVMTSHVTAIAGAVVDERDKAVSDAAVVAFAADRSLWYAGSRFVGHADAGRDGAFNIRALAPGDYHVAVVDKRQVVDVNGEIENPEYLESLVAHATRVTLSEGQRTTLTLKMF
jgi:hypothetical protein